MRPTRFLTGLAGLTLIVFGLPLLIAAQSAQVTTGGGPTIEQAQKESAFGAKARIAVSRVTNKTGKGWWSGAIGDGMADMLGTSLFNTNRFIVLERQAVQDVFQEQNLGASGRVSKETAAIGKIEGAELLVMGAVTEFEPGSSGGGGSLSGWGVPGWGGKILGGLSGAFKEAHMAIDLRLVDVRTSRIVAGSLFKLLPLFLGFALILLGAINYRAIGNWLGFAFIPEEKHILVLPFTNVSGEKNDQAFCDGLVEILTSQLSQMEQFQGSLLVIPTSEVRQSGISSASQAQQHFGANLVISGSVQRNEDRVQLTMNLIDAKELRQLNSAIISDRLKGSTDFQDKIVDKLIEMLEVKLHPKKPITGGREHGKHGGPGILPGSARVFSGL